MAKLRCKWFRCRGTFTPERAGQVFCCNACRAAEKNWRSVRGRQVVEPLIDWYRMRHATKEQRRSWELANHRPAPTLTQVQLLVAEWIAELEADAA